MLDALISGKLIKDTELKTGQSGKTYCQFLLGVHVGEPENIIVSGVAFGAHAERISKLGKGDGVSVIGSLKPTEWPDKSTGEARHGLSVTVSGVLSIYDINKKRKTEGVDNQHDQQAAYYI